MSIDNMDVVTIDGMTPLSTIDETLNFEGSLQGVSGKANLGQVVALVLSKIPDATIVVKQGATDVGSTNILNFIGNSVSVTQSSDAINVALHDIEIVSDGTYIKWKYANEAAYTNILPLADIAGKDGEDGKDGTNGVDGTNGIDGKDGEDGINGVDGKQIELQTTATAIQWRYVGEAWQDLILLSAIKGVDGKEVEMDTNSTHIRWRYVGSTSWTNLIALADIKGDDGRNPELQKSVSHIQWRLVGDSAWTNLVALAELKGEAGTGLVNKGTWIVDTVYEPGDYVFATSSEDANTTSMFIAQAETSFTSTTPPKDDSVNWVEFSAPAGANGKQIELQVTPTAIQWRYEGENWVDLIQLSALKGTDGKQVELDANETHVRWRYVGDTNWSNLVPLSTLTGPVGADGKQIELSTSATHIQWRYVGDANWTNLIALDLLKGTPGNDGTDGVDGKGIASSVVTYQSSVSGTVTPTGTWTATIPAVPAGSFLWSRTVVTYTDDTQTTVYSVAYHGQDGSGSTGTANTAHVLTADPTAAVGESNDVALVRLASGTISAWKRGASSWAKTWEQKLATTTEAKAASLSTIATTPAGVREFLEQYGLASTYTTAPADLNSVVRGEFFNWGDTTSHAPIAGSYGRGICIPAGSGYVTQWSIENNTGVMHVRFQENGTWTEWKLVGGSGEGSSYTLPTATSTTLGGIKVGANLSITPDGVLSATSSGEGGGSGGTELIIDVLQAPFVNQQLTLQPINTVNVTAGMVYKVSFMGVVKPTATDIGFKIGTAGSFGALTLNLHATYRDGTGIVERALITKQSTAEFPTSEYANEGNLLKVEGLLHVITSGDFGISFAVTKEWDYASVIAGSSLVLTPLGTAPTS